MENLELGILAAAEEKQLVCQPCFAFACIFGVRVGKSDY